MTREEIREGMLTISRKYRNLSEGRAELLVEELRDFLHKRGVVIKIPVAPPIGGSAKMCCYEELID